MMEIGERMERARRLANLQKLRTTEVLEKPEELPAIGSQMERPRAIPTRMAMRVTEVVELVNNAREMPWGLRKAWVYLLVMVGVLVAIPALIVAPIGGIIILPLIVGALWILGSTPFWLAKSVTPPQRNNPHVV